MSIQIIERDSARVLTTNQLAKSYGADEKLIQQNFSNNKSRYKEEKHFILLKGEELKRFKRNFENLGIAQNVNKLYLWTEKGAWLHAKSLNTDRAWDAYEMLVDQYYEMQSQVKVLSEKEQLMASMKLSLETAGEIEGVKKEVTEIRSMVENQITLDHGEQRRLQIAVATKVYELESDRLLQPKLFKEIYREIKNRFGVASYKDVKRQELQSAIKYVDAWLPRKVS